VAVAGVLVVTRTPTLPPSTPAGASLAAVSAQSGGAIQVAGSEMVPSAPSPVSEPESSFATGKVIRDAGLDRYLAAHKHFAGSAALGVPSAFLRGATVDASGR
jgi:sigma-E factor negative regulatory protein RseA